jgi:hypothetical protein
MASEASGSGAAHGAPSAADLPPLTLDECREAFYVAQRACERYAGELRAFVELLDSKKAAGGEAWIEAVQDESRKASFFHSNQLSEWEGFSERADAYVDSVRRLAELMAIAGAAALGAERGAVALFSSALRARMRAHAARPGAHAYARACAPPAPGAAPWPARRGALPAASACLWGLAAAPQVHGPGACAGAWLRCIGGRCEHSCWGQSGCPTPLLGCALEQPVACPAVTDARSLLYLPPSLGPASLPAELKGETLDEVRPRAPRAACKGRAAVPRLGAAPPRARAAGRRRAPARAPPTASLTPGFPPASSPRPSSPRTRRARCTRSC